MPYRTPYQHSNLTSSTALESLTGSGWPKWQAEGVIELWTLINEGREETTGATDDLEAILGRKGTTTAAWVASVADGFRA